MSTWTSDEADAFEAAESAPLRPRRWRRGPTPYLDDLNPAQRAAVEALDGPVLVLAGAGTGKTKALTARIAHLLNTGRARPNEILAVTFTNKAAREMKTRVGHLVGGVIEGMPWLGTFHSLSVRILRRHAELVGLKSNFTILDTDDQLRLLRQLIQAANIDEKRWPPRLLASLIDGWKNRALAPERVPSSESCAFDHRGSRALRRLPGSASRTLNACDFGDLLLHVRRHPAGPPRRPRPVPALVPLHPRRRVPGHQRRPVPLAAPARRPPTATSAASATTTSRSTAGAAPRSATSCASRRTSPAPRSSASSRTTAPPRTSSPPPPASSPPTRAASARPSGPTSPRARRSASSATGTARRRRAGSARRSRRSPAAPAASTRSAPTASPSSSAPPTRCAPSRTAS